MQNLEEGNAVRRNIWSKREQTRWFCLLLIGTCLLYATRTSLPLLMPVVNQEKHWTKAESGIILSSFFWGYVLTQTASGYLSDRFGGQKIMWIAALGWSATTFFMSNTIEFASVKQHSIIFIVFARIINGAFQGMHFPSVISLTSQHVEETQRASFFGLITSGSALGTLLTGCLGSYIISNHHWHFLFQLLGGLSLIWTFLLYYRSSKLHSKRNKNTEISFKHFPWRILFSKPPFWACIFAHACQNACFFVLLSWMPTYFHDKFPHVHSGMVNMIPWLSLVPCTFLGKIFTDKFIKNGYSITTTRKIIETISLLMQSINLLFLTQVTNYQSAMLCLLFIIGGTGFHNTAIAVNPSDLAPQHPGSVFGVMNSVGALSGFFGVYLAGWLLHLTHNWPEVFFCIAVINLLGLAVFLTFGSAEAIII